jgi:cell division transport system permease protein
VTFLQAIAYFAREAAVNLVRSWKVSLLAIVTIAVSLFLAGLFFLVGGNLQRVVERWYGESKIVVYLDEAADPAAVSTLREKIAAAPWTVQVDSITAEDAEQRFRNSFPSLGDLLEGWSEDPLPASLEVGLDWQGLDRRTSLDSWLRDLRADPAVTMIDDDRDWLSQIRAVSVVIEAAGWVLGSILLLTAIFTIASVIRLTAYLYRDEIAVMRLVGATEFFIRGPFYVEGMLQGLAGGTLAVTALLGVHALLLRRQPENVLASFLASDFLRPGQLAALVALGGLAGLMGAVASLRKERLGATAEIPEADEA